jgi:hypothetical protein
VEKRRSRGAKEKQQWSRGEAAVEQRRGSNPSFSESDKT